MQARSRWLMFFLAVIALLVVAIWPRSTSNRGPHLDPAASAPGRITRGRRSSQLGAFIVVRGSGRFLSSGPGGTARERKTPGNQSDVSWREH